MVTEKMKLRILEAISEDLAKHVDSVFQRLIHQRDHDYSLEEITKSYLLAKGKPAHLVDYSLKTSEVVDVKRDIAFIYYCLSCPFYYSLGVDERLSKTRIRNAVSTLNISRAKFPSYIMSAKHFYRIYPDYRKMINDFVEEYIKKE